MDTYDPRTEANIATLIPKAQEAARAFMAQAVPAMQVHGAEVKIISGTRTYAEQTALYAQGRTAPGSVVTRAPAGYSDHNFGIAWDIGIFLNGKYLDDSPLYAECGKIGVGCGLEWGGNWKSIDDEPHFQLSTGLTLAQMRDLVAQGKTVA